MLLNLKDKYNICDILLNTNKNYGVTGYLSSDEFKRRVTSKYYSYSFATPKYFNSVTNSFTSICNTREEADSYLHELFANWAAERIPEWARMKAALEAEYNPIENYDRWEEGGWTDAKHKGSKTSTTRTDDLTELRTPNLTDTRTLNLTDTRTPNLTQEETDDISQTRSPNLTDTTSNNSQLYGYDNSSTASNDSAQSGSVTRTGSETNTADNTITTKFTGTESNTQTGSDTLTKNGTETLKNTGTQTVESSSTDISATVFDKDVRSFEGYHVHGNIGTTQNQSMVENEILLRVNYDLLDIIVREFVDNFLII